MSNSPLIRTVARTVLAKEYTEGVGANVLRSIGTDGLSNLDPFLMLDQFTVCPPAGFSDHPHRGFETVTYTLDGEFEHEDFTGHSGRIKAGDLQWMTAGRGIVHAEVPVAPINTGMQLWVNLPAQHKMMEPKYQELSRDQVPVVTPGPGASVKLIAGEAFGQSALVHTLTSICYFDVELSSATPLKIPVPSSFNTFIYVLDGSVLVGNNNTATHKHNCIVLDSFSSEMAKANNVSEVSVTAPTPGGTRFLLIGGEPIGEPIVKHGPFVMNTWEQVQEAIDDYRQCKNGFERGANFCSKISQRVKR